MKKTTVFFVFLTFFIVSLVLFFPYKKAYNSLILHLAHKNNIGIAYKINYVSPFSLDLKNIVLKIQHRRVDVENCRIKFTPISLIFGRTLAKIYLTINGKEGQFNIGKKNGGYTVSGVFYTKMLIPFADKDVAGFLQNFNGTDSVRMTLKQDENMIKIEKLKVAGDFDVAARGFIQNGNLKLMGVIKVGKMKESFSF